MEERLNRLERENRRLKEAGALTLAAIAVVVIMGQAMPSKVVEAEKFVVRDASGKVHAALGTVNKRAVSLALIDKNGNPRVVLGVLSDGSPSLSFYDKDMNRRAVLGLRADDSPDLALLDRDRKLRARLSLNDEGSATLVFIDSGGKIGASLIRTRLSFFDKDGRVTWKAP
ncbi:MAG: hypothetical protein ACE5MK_08200 [Acidobacteriota bacterium]